MSVYSSAWRTLFERNPESGASEEEIYCEAPQEFTGGNSLAPLHDGREAYPAMLAAIAGARKTVHLETYVLRDDKTGWTFARALAARARAAVRVRVLYDSVGSLNISPGYLQFLRNNGVALLEYRPLAPWRRGKSAPWLAGWSKRDHRKILVVDGRIGFTGGINISDDFAEPAQGGGDWRDTDVRIEGPAAYELDRLFRAVWFRETGRWFELAGHPDQAAGTSLVRVAANQEFLNRHRIRKAYLHALRRSRRAVSIANAYFIPDRGIRKALYLARRRGVSVRILVPGTSDIPAVAYAGHRLFEDLLRHGVRLYEWPGPVLHAKTVVVDGIWSAVGSYNMDHRSLLHNLEVNLHILNREFGRRMEESFEQDLRRSREITLRAWTGRPAGEKLLERLYYLVRYWL